MLDHLPEGLIALVLHNSRLFSEKQLRTLLLACDSPSAIFQLSSDKLSLLGCDLLDHQQLNELLEQLIHLKTRQPRNYQLWEYCLEQQIGVVAINQEGYPALLKTIYDPPPVLYYRGNLDLLQQPQLAIVGSRRCSKQGLNNARLFSRELTATGFAICSGMALGIDSEAHRACLALEGATIAVLGTGVDKIYPRQNAKLYEDIAQYGLLISELPPTAPARKSHFPRRNRIISGLSLGVIVVEADIKSGSLITARLALEQNREVFALPGSIHNQSSRGCHEIIRQGAKLTETTEHILEELKGWLPQSIAEKPIAEPKICDLEPSLAKLLKQLSFHPQPIDSIHQQLNYPINQLMSDLLALELLGLVENIAGAYQRLQ